MIKAAQPQQKYLYLLTIKELIIAEPEALKVYLGELQELLMEQASNKDANIRSIVAECTGRFFVYASDDLEAFVLDGIDNNNPLVHATFAKALTFSGRHS